MSIIEFINKFKKEDRDKNVAMRINKWLDDNIDALNDGFIEHFLIIGNKVNAELLEFYNIDKEEWSNFKKINKELKKGYAILDDLLNLCLLASYHDTKQEIYLDIILIKIAGSKMSHYFKYRTSDAYKNRMRYTIEKELSPRSYIRTEGTMYGALKAMMVEYNSGVNKNKLDNLNKDENISFFLGRIRTTINRMIQRLMGAFTKTTEKALVLTKDYQEDDNDATEIATRTTLIKKIDYYIDEFNPSNYDYNLFKILGIKDEVERNIMQGLLDSDKNFFKRYAKIYIDYYMKDFYTNVNDMQKNWVYNMSSARIGKAKNADTEGFIKLEKELLVEMGVIQKELGYRKGDFDLATKIRYTKVFKNYVILKMKLLFNKL